MDKTTKACKIAETIYIHEVKETQDREGSLRNALTSVACRATRGSWRCWKADLKRQVLRRYLKVGKSEQSRMGLGRKFQRVGAAMEETLSPLVRCLVLSGGETRFASVERRPREQGGKAAGRLIVEGFVGKEEDFEVDAVGDWEPIEFVKDRGNVAAGAGVGE